MPKQKFNHSACQDIIAVYEEIKHAIESRLCTFQKLWEKGTEYEIFEELVFCLLTPQTKARQSEKAVTILKQNNLLINGTAKEIAKHLNIVRFRNKKAQYIVQARDKLFKNGKPVIKKILKMQINPHAMREFLVNEIKGLGWKEASHFLRNVGIGKHFAILDRHILKNLAIVGCIERVPTTLTKEQYLLIEENMRTFAKTLRIPFEHLDFVFWYMETRDIFK